jgi:Protein of unknown function (DUF664)
MVSIDCRAIGNGRAVSSAGVTPETERAGLRECLDLQREALIAKLAGLSEKEARRAATVSSLSLLGLVKHSAYWERMWFQVIAVGRGTDEEFSELDSEDGDRTFVLADLDTIESVVADYRTQIAASNEIIDHFDLDGSCEWPEMAHRSLRWVSLHMIEETARHAGHADIIRETIDGSREP